jgi:hypothetical protein
VIREQGLQQCNRLDEIKALFDHNDIDGVEILLAPKAACEVGPAVCGGIEFGADGTQESKLAFRLFPRQF